MLVITRKTGESVVIDGPGGRITLQLLETKGSKAKLGLTAPLVYQVHYPPKKEEDRASAQCPEA